jgi:3-dehydrotetronate 4-kinase
VQLGCIADDYTGASDVATALSRTGHRTVLLFGPPRDGTDVDGADAIVIALKIRMAPARVAVEDALAAHGWLAQRGAERFYFKYCSTFDSTDAGNIGPIAEALLTATGAPLTVVCPAAPEHGRTVYQGHLFVGSSLLSDTPMREHPLTPMRDPSVVRMLDRQTTGPVELVPHDCVRSGPEAIARRLSELRQGGVRFAVVDALDETDLRNLAEAARGLVLLTGSAGLAPHLGEVDAASAGVPPPTRPAGPAAILAGSCSAATLEQVARAQQRYPSFRVDPRGAANADALLKRCLEWLDATVEGEPVMLYSSAPPDERSADEAGVVEQVMAAVGRRLVKRGSRCLVVAGGETAAAVVDAIDVTACTLGAEEARGVPWLFANDSRGLALLLKSGNFGDPDLLVRAAERAA